MDNQEYIIINKTAIQKRIEECNKCLTFVNKEHDASYQKEIDVLQSVMSQSTPLIPEIQKAYKKAFTEGVVFGLHTEYKYQTSEEYIANLKLDI